MVRIAITGGIACGKSFVAAIFARNGFRICEADELAHQAMLPGGEAYDSVVRRFGEGILCSNGEIDRRILGDIVFGSRALLAELNALVHPVVKSNWESWIDAGGEVSRNALIVPLLFEGGFETGWDAVVSVAASESKQYERLAQRGFKGANAAKRIEAQLPVTEKMRRSDFVIVNNWGIEILEQQTERIIRKISERKNGC